MILINKDKCICKIIDIIEEKINNNIHQNLKKIVMKNINNNKNNRKICNVNVKLNNLCIMDN